MADDVLSRSAPDTRYIVVHETVLQSWAKDAGTLAMFAGMTAFAEFALGGSVWAYASAGVLFGAWVLSKAVAAVSRRTAAAMTRDELVAMVRRFTD